MRSLFTFIAVLVAGLFAFGCASHGPSPAEMKATQLNQQAIAAKSPYRYRADRNAFSGSGVERYRITPPPVGPVPGGLQPTTAEDDLQKKILSKIQELQQEWGGEETPVLLGVQLLDQADGIVREAWFIKSNDGAIRYEVKITPSSLGNMMDFKSPGPGFSVQGP